MLTLTDSNFDEEIKKATVSVVVDFWAPWCGPCKLMEPIVEELDKEMAGKFVFSKVNVDENPTTASKFGIMSIPTTIIFKKGVEVKRIVGFSGKEAIVKELNTLT